MSEAGTSRSSRRGSQRGGSMSPLPDLKRTPSTKGGHHHARSSSGSVRDQQETPPTFTVGEQTPESKHRRKPHNAQTPEPASPSGATFSQSGESFLPELNPKAAAAAGKARTPSPYGMKRKGDAQHHHGSSGSDEAGGGGGGGRHLPRRRTQSKTTFLPSAIGDGDDVTSIEGSGIDSDDDAASRRRRSRSHSQTSMGSFGDYKKRYSFASFSSNQKPVEELLAPRRVVPDEFEQEVQRKLVNLRKRNSVVNIENVMERHRQAQLEYAEMIAERGKVLEARQTEAQHQRDIMKGDRHFHENREEASQRAQNWQQNIVAVNFGLLVQKTIVEYHAMTILRRWLPAMLVRVLAVRKKRRDAAKFTKQRLEENPCPTPPMLQHIQGDFFKDWSFLELSDLIRKMTPRSYHAGEHIMFDGDFDRLLYILNRGSVEIQIRKKGIGSKKRTPENSMARIPVSAPAYFGEFALLCKEPRSATIVCSEDCDCWVITHEDFQPQLEHLSIDIQNRLEATTDKRRKDNLKKFFPMRVEHLKKHSFFNQWTQEQLQQIIAVAEPQVLRPGHVLYREGDVQPLLYFVTDGTIKLTTQRRKSTALDPTSPVAKSQQQQSHGGPNKAGPKHRHSGPGFSTTTKGESTRKSMSGTFGSASFATALSSTTKSGSISPSKGGGDKYSETSLPEVAYRTFGETLGEFEAFFSHQRRKQTAITETGCDVWSVHHDQLLDIGITNAAAMIESRRMIQELRASRLVRPVNVPSFITTDPWVQYAIPASVIQAAWPMAKADVLCSSDLLIKEGDEANQLIAIVSGSVHIRFSNRDWTPHNDVIEVDPVHGLLCRPGAEAAHPIVIGTKSYPHNICVLFPHLTHLYGVDVVVPHFHTAPSATASSPSTTTTSGHLTNAKRKLSLGSTTGALALQGLTAPSKQFPPGTVGLLFGAYEFASRKQRYQFTVKCTSTVELWRIDRSALENALTDHCLNQLESTESVTHVNNCFSSRKIAAVVEEGVARPSHALGHGHHHGHHRGAKRSHIRTRSRTDSIYTSSTQASTQSSPKTKDTAEPPPSSSDGNY